MGVMPRTQTGDPALKTYARVRLRRTIRTQAIATGRGCEVPTCLMATRAIDWDAPRGHPAAYVLDEIKARALGGRADDPNNVRPAHHRCNSHAGQALGQRMKRINKGNKTKALTTTQPATTEGRW